MGHVINTPEDKITYPWTVYQSFNRVGDTPIPKQKYAMHLGELTPPEWLNNALAMSEAMGISNTPVTRDDNEKSLRYTFQFHSKADQMRFITAIEGVVHKPKGYALAIKLKPSDPDERMDEHIAALDAFCGLRNISYTIKALDGLKGREVEILFDRNVDYYAVQLAQHEGGDINRHLEVLQQQRQNAALPPPQPVKSGGSAGFAVMMAGLVTTAMLLRR